MTDDYDDGICRVRWCGEARGHTGPHRKCLLDTMAVDVQSWRPAICQLWLQGESARVHAIVLVANGCEVGLTWTQARQLRDAVNTAVRRFA